MFWKIDGMGSRFSIGKRDVIPIDHFITLTIVHGVFKVGRDIHFGKFGFQVEFQNIGLKVIFDIDNIIIVGHFFNGIVRGEFTPFSFI